MAKIYLPNSPQEPIKLSRELKNPFTGINDQCDRTNAETSDIIKATHNIQERLLGLCLIVRADIESVLKEGQKQIKELSRKIPKDGMFFILDEDGKKIFAGIPNMPVLQGIGSADEEITTGLDAYRKKMRSLPALQIEHFTENILGSTTGKLILETGAGTDIGRIRKLSEKTKAEGGLLVCHDPAPYAAKLTQKEIPDVPYLTLPARSELLLPILQPSPRPKIITLKDTISSMTYGNLNELMFIAKELKAEKLIISQSLAIAPTANYLPEGAKIQDEYFMKYFMNSVTKNLQLFIGQHQRVLMLVFGEQLRNSVMAIMMEIVRFKLLNDLKAGYLHCTTELSTTCEMVAAEQVQEFLDQYHPNYYPQFQQGSFNTFNFSPFGIAFSRENVRKGTLKISQTQFHIIASKTPTTTKGQAILNDDILTPPTQRIIDIHHAQAIAEQIWEPAHIPQLKKCLAYANKCAIDYIYSILGDQIKQPDIVRSSQTDRQKLLQSFVENLK